MWEREVRWRRVVVVRDAREAMEAEAVRWVSGRSADGCV